MTQTLLLILGIIIVAVLLTQKGRERVKGICAAALGQDAKKREHKVKILALFAGAKQEELNNEDIRNAFGLSRRSVTRYMTELEREGWVKQVGKSGRGVIYRLGHK